MLTSLMVESRHKNPGVHTAASSRIVWIIFAGFERSMHHNMMAVHEKDKQTPYTTNAEASASCYARLTLAAPSLYTAS